MDTVLDLGDQYVVNFIPQEEVDAWKNGQVEQKVPLQLCLCANCKFIQLRHSVDPDRLYRKFWYKSGINESMRTTLKGIVDQAIHRMGDVWKVLDIGSNDGTLLSFYPESFLKVGMDPAENLVEEAKVTAGTDHILAAYFSEESLPRLENFGKFHIITAISMFYDLEDPVDFLHTIHRVLAPNGICIIQMNYILSMLEQNAVDNICHEHLGYYSLSVLKRLVEACGLEVLDATTNDVNGGSIKVTIGHSGMPVNEAQVNDILEREAEARLDDIGMYRAFVCRVNTIFAKIRAYIQSEKQENVYLYGASTRGTTLMQCLKLDNTSVAGVAERNPEKTGLCMVGSWIPIVSEEEARKHATVMMVLPWHFKSSILAREEETLMHSVRFLFPLPTPRLFYGAEL